MIGTDHKLVQADLVLLGIKLNKALSSCAVIVFVEHAFQIWKTTISETLQLHPGNNWLFSVIEDSIETALVYAKQVVIKWNLGDDVHGWSNLKKYQHVIAHPTHNSYEHAVTQRNISNRLHIFNPKFMTIWGVLASLSEWAEEQGLRGNLVLKPGVILYPECVDTVCSILSNVTKGSDRLSSDDLKAEMVKLFHRLEHDAKSIYEEEIRTGILEGDRTRESYRAMRLTDS